MGTGAADPGGRFINTTSVRVAKSKGSRSGGIVLCRIFAGMARIGTFNLVGWNHGGLVPRAARRGASLLYSCFLNEFVVRAARAGRITLWRKLLDRFAFGAAHLGRLASRGRICIWFILCATSIGRPVLNRPGTFTRDPLQARRIVQGLILGEGAVAPNRIQ